MTKISREPIFWTTFESPWGELFVAASEKGLIRVSLPSERRSSIFRNGDLWKSVELIELETRLLSSAKKQLLEFFQGSRTFFDLPLDLRGTPFQKKVWKALCTVSYAQTASYQDIARKVGNVRATRAVGMANNKNPIPIVIPCHRIIGKNGTLVGYGGGLPMKERLLRLERTHSNPVGKYTSLKPLLRQIAP